MNRLAVWLAQGLGLGLLPKAPGTWGSILGVGVGIAFLLSGLSGWLLAIVLTVLVLLSIQICTMAEKALGAHDPGSVVLDEIWGVALVIIYQPWVVRSVWWILVAFVLFRIFDIIKPAPLKWMAKAPKGWGIMLDDLGASVYAIGVLMLTHQLIGA